jgi:gamma-glutamyltranspeptidase/glutathione hydrolase
VTAYERGAVAAGHASEVAAGVRMLEQGGNAIDAVVAAAFTAFVVEPVSCGLGGYGHLSMFLADGGRFVTVDHGPRAPAASREDMFELADAYDGGDYDWPQVVGRRNEIGPLATAVPGAVAGLCAAHDQAGRLPLAQVLEPAIEAADAGLEVAWNIVLAVVSRLDQIREIPSAAAYLLDAGDPLTHDPYFRATRKLDTSALAATLRAIATSGPAAFHGGPAARAIEAEVARGGGILTAADLEAYRPKIMHEPPATYRDVQYVTANDQVGYEVLNILDQFPPAAAGSAEFYHLMAEAFGHAFVDNVVWFGDPDHVESPLTGLASRGFAAMRAAGIRPDQAAPRPITAADPRPFDPGANSPGTTQMTAADADGNVAALITTVGHDFGSLVYVEEVGCFLNSSMVNYDPRPGRGNSIAPGKMPYFAVPSIVAARDGKAILGACGSGGYRILSGVVHAFVHAVDFGMDVAAAVAAPRVYCQGQETFVDARIPVDVQAALAGFGHTVVAEVSAPGAEPFARVSAVALAHSPGGVETTSASDPPWSTAASGS